MTDDCQRDLSGAVNLMTDNVVQFIPRSNVDRHKLAQQAKAIYESIFPSDLAMHHADPEDRIATWRDLNLIKIVQDGPRR